MASQIFHADDQVLVRYLLDALPEDEVERFDEASIGDDAFAVRLRVVEQDLIDAYVRRRLPRDITALFEATYLSSTKRRQRVRVAEVFLAAVDRAAAQVDADAKKRTGPFGLRMRSVAAAILSVVDAAVARLKDFPDSAPTRL